MGFDQYAQFYNSYYVSQAKIRIQLMRPAFPCTVACIASYSLIAGDRDLSLLMEDPATKVMMYHGLEGRNRNLYHTLNLKDFLGNDTYL